MREFDTIAAVATSMGDSSISIIRVSGNRALPIVSSIFKGKNGRELKDIKSYTMRYGHIIQKESGEIIDEVIVSYMKGPKSFTAEDTVEIGCHGGVISTRKVLEEVVGAGARTAEPGEFTKRAFLNGRIDLSQAEAVIDIIRSKTELSMKSALSQSQGRISGEINMLRNRLLGVIAHIEATVDFPEDDLEEITSEKVLVDLEEILDHIENLLRTASHGKILREGLNVVIAGKPNVGKSSLLNALLMEKRAIVTDIPGTTRDVIEEYLNIEGIPIKIIDTAGIRHTEDVVEKIGVEKSREKIDEADLIIFMLDLSREIDEEDREIISSIINKKYIVLLNKSDLPRRLTREDIAELGEKYTVEISTITGEGIDRARQLILDLFYKGEVAPADVIVTNSRHIEALLRAKERCLAALDTLRSKFSIDFASIDVRSAWSHLGEITGETLDEDIIDKIFSEFCIGK